jgi:hypothetical protein
MDGMAAGCPVMGKKGQAPVIFFCMLPDNETDVQVPLSGFFKILPVVPEERS